MGNERLAHQTKEIIDINEEIDQQKALLVEFKYKLEEEENKTKHSEDLLRT